MKTIEEIKAELRAQILTGKKTEAPKIEVETPVESTQVETSPEVEAPVEAPKRQADQVEATREAWLEQAWQMLKSHFSEKSAWPLVLPEVRLSVGFARGKRPGKRLTAQTIFETEDAIPQIFVTPLATDADTILTLLVEQVAVIRSKQTGERLVDAKTRCGLYDSPKAEGASTLPTAQLHAILTGFLSVLGPYPHAAVTSNYKPRDSGGVKTMCHKSGYKVRIAQSWIDKHGPPICPCCNEKMTVGDIPF